MRWFAIRAGLSKTESVKIFKQNSLRYDFEREGRDERLERYG